MNDMFLFSDDESDVPDINTEPWNILIVDDEEDVHAVTSLALASFEFNGRRLNLLHA